MEERIVKMGAAPGVAAFEAKNGKGLPVVLVRFMCKMFGNGGYKLKKEKDREDVWTFDTYLCHYRVACLSDTLAVVKAWPKVPRREKMAEVLTPGWTGSGPAPAPRRMDYSKINPTAMWKISAADGGECEG